MLASQSVFVVDAHTTGTPIRVVTGGIPPLKGASVAEKMKDMRRNHDWRAPASCSSRAGSCPSSGPS